MTVLGDYLKENRVRQNTIAKEIGKPASTVSRVINSSQEITDQNSFLVINAIAKILNKTPGKILDEIIAFQKENYISLDMSRYIKVLFVDESGLNGESVWATLPEEEIADKNSLNSTSPWEDATPKNSLSAKSPWDDIKPRKETIAVTKGRFKVILDNMSVEYPYNQFTPGDTLIVDKGDKGLPIVDIAASLELKVDYTALAEEQRQHTLEEIKKLIGQKVYTKSKGVGTVVDAIDKAEPAAVIKYENGEETRPNLSGLRDVLVK